MLIAFYFSFTIQGCLLQQLAENADGTPMLHHKLCNMKILLTTSRRNQQQCIIQSQLMDHHGLTSPM
jgi:hypothetical protein